MTMLRTFGLGSARPLEVAMMLLVCCSTADVGDVSRILILGPGTWCSLVGFKWLLPSMQEVTDQGPMLWNRKQPGPNWPWAALGEHGCTGRTGRTLQRHSRSEPPTLG